MFNAEKLLGGLLGSAMRGQGQGGSLGGLGSLAGSGKATLAMGLIGVAAAAFEHFNERREQNQAAGAPGQSPAGPPPLPGSGGLSASRPAAVPPPPPPGVRPATPAAERSPVERAEPLEASPESRMPQPAEQEAVLYVRGMIAAAAADGVVDETERQRILGQLETAGLDAEERAFMLHELDHPASIDELCNAVQTPAQGLNLYICSLLAVDVDTDAERHHLRRLAGCLKLSADALDEVHRRYQVSI